MEQSTSFPKLPIVLKVSLICGPSIARINVLSTQAKMLKNNLAEPYFSPRQSQENKDRETQKDQVL